ncbi:MAG: energy-coupling factor transporter transmembrane protein EcfT [Firmicutes bacterium]|nr:energy-coupling factor transporter transmembrane protein EcfT [Bacillota bacterium]
MKNKDNFSSYNPILNFFFFVCAIGLGMFFMHPAFLVCSFVLSLLYYVTIEGLKGFKFFVLMVPLILLLALINPLFNTAGTHILFIYFGRAYTLEGLLYGVAIAFMFVSILNWFASYNAVMTSDKFIYIFGKFLPSISLVLTMILRLVPNFQRKASQIGTARMCIGKAGENTEKKEKIENGMTVLSGLATWALEGGIITADSMRSRGYGSGKRTNFAIYRFDSRDLVLLIVMIGLVAGICVCGFMGGAAVIYTPVLEITFNIYTIIGSVMYFCLLAIPSVINIMEEIIWRILRSRI